MRGHTRQKRMRTTVLTYSLFYDFYNMFVIWRPRPSFSPRLCSCVSPDMFERRSVQLEDTLPVPSWFHRPALPVPAPAYPARSGGEGQQAARLPHVVKTRRPEARGATGHGAHPALTNALGLHPALVTSRAPLIRRYLSFGARAQKLNFMIWGKFTSQLSHWHCFL